MYTLSKSTFSLKAYSREQVSGMHAMDLLLRKRVE